MRIFMEGTGSPSQAGGIPQWLAEFMENQRAVNESLRQSNQQLSAQLELLANSNTSGSFTGASTASTPLIPTVISKPKHSRRHPDPYTHEDESAYPQFRGGLEAKLRIDALAIGQEEEQVWYAVDCLKGLAAKRIYPWVEFAKGTDKFTVRELFLQMDTAFADPQKEAKAVSKINKIKQGSRPFREFLQEFEQTLLEAKGWAWADTIKKGLLKAALSGELTDRLIGREEPTDYASYCAGIRKVADDLQAWKDARKFRARPGTQPLRTSPAPAESMDWEPTRTTTAAAARTRQAGTEAPRAKWVSKEVRSQRWEAGACLRCGSRDHRQENCQLRPARPPAEVEEVRKGPQKKSKVASTSAKKKADVEEVFTDDSDEDSGKE
jgi:hypothetical protein